MKSDMELLLKIMEYKKWLDMGFYEALQSPAYEGKADLVQEALYWMNHIHIVDKIFKAHLLGEQHGFESTESSSFPSMLELQDSARVLDEWLICYAKRLDEKSAYEKINFLFTDGDKGCMSRAEMLMHISTHGLCHISATSQWLDREGFPTPPVLWTSWVSKV